jgi:hypothetical protein
MYDPTTISVFYLIPFPNVTVPGPHIRVDLERLLVEGDDGLEVAHFPAIGIIDFLQCIYLEKHMDILYSTEFDGLARMWGICSLKVM